MPNSPTPRPPTNLRKRLGGRAIQGFFSGSSRLARALPAARPHRHGIEVTQNLRYGEAIDEHRVDVYRPLKREGPLPVVLYVHGGGFRILSKDTHWIFGTMFARAGYLTFVVDYRLAPRFPFPAGLQDTVDAYKWVLAHAAEFGGDPSRIVVAGESAGANLVTSLTLATCSERPEPWARAAFDTNVVPTAVIAACGVFEVSNPGRFARPGAVARFVQDRLEEISADYLAGEADPVALELADPVIWLEKKPALARRIPPFFAPCGTSDVLIHDARRLKSAIEGLGGSCEAPEYPGGVHAFHAFVFTKLAKSCWKDTYAWMERTVGPVR